MRVCVTGATGFIGEAVVRRLLAGGDEVAAFARKPPPANGAALLPRAGDIRDAAAVDAALEGAAALVHLAAVTSTGSHDRDASFAVNVEGTRRLVEGCLRKSVRRFVYIGTVSSLRPRMGNYGASKLEGERVVRESGLEVTVIRPHLVYGPGERGLFARLVALVRKSPVVPVLGSGRNPVQPVHVDDVAAAIAEALRRPEAVGRDYNLVGPDTVTMNRFTDMVCEVLSRRRWRLNIPGPIALVLAGASGLVLKDPPFTRDNLVGMEQDTVWTSEDAARDLGFAPRPLAAGLREALARS